MQNVARDMAEHLNDGGFGDIGGLTGWTIHVNYEPEKAKTTISVYDVGNPTSIYSVDTSVEPFEYAFFKVTTRSKDQNEASDKMYEILDYLENAGKFILGDTTYHNIFKSYGPYYDRKSEDDYFVFVTIFRAPREKTGS